MIKSATAFLLTLLAGLSSAHQGVRVPSGAGPRAAVADVSRLVAQADAVLKGEVLSSEQVGTLEYSLQSGESTAIKVMSARVRVDSTLKGPTPTAAEMAITWYVSDVPAGLGILRTGDYGLFYAALSEAGYVVSDLEYPWTPVSKRPLGADALPPPGGALGAVEAELTNSLEDSDVGIACSAAASLATLPYGPPTATALLEVGSHHPDARVRGRAIQSLLSHGHSEALSLAMEVLANGLSPEAVRTLDASIPAEAASALKVAQHAAGIRAQLLVLAGAAIQKKADLPYARQLLQFPELLARDEGLQGLRHIGPEAANDETVPLLIGLLRDDDLGWSASLTLSEITDHRSAEWAGPSREGFRADRDAHVARWTTWWETEGRSRYAR